MPNTSNITNEFNDKRALQAQKIMNLGGMACGVHLFVCLLAK